MAKAPTSLTLLTILFCALGALSGCAESTMTASVKPSAEASNPPGQDAAIFTAVAAAWEEKKRQVWAAARHRAPTTSELLEAARSVKTSDADRDYMLRFYEARSEAVFFDDAGQLSAAGRRALEIVSEAWSHGIDRPTHWPDIAGATEAMDLSSQLEQVFKAPLSDADLRAVSAHIRPTARPRFDAGTLSDEGLGQLQALETLISSRPSKAAALDAALLAALWRLDKTMRLPLPSSKFGHKWRHKARRRLAEMRKDNPVRVWPEKNLALVSPSHGDYRALRLAFVKYRALQAAGSLEPPKADFGSTLALGDVHPGLREVRSRLSAEGFDAVAEEGSEATFDASLVKGLKAFQETRALTQTGALDKKTLAALKVPAEALLEKIRLSLRRWQRSLSRLEPYYVRVNIPQYQVQLVEGHQVAERYDAAVGRPWTQTPRFEGVIYRVEVHPWWWGVRDDPKRVPPGPHNPLGQLVMRVQPHHLLIFLHGTNKPRLLERSNRALSHGCVRLKEPTDLGGRIVDRDTHPLSSQELKSLVEGRRRNKKIDLRQPVPVFFEYVTAFINTETGRLHFSPDIYRDDARQIPPGRRVLESLQTWDLAAPEPSDLQNRSSAPSEK